MLSNTTSSFKLKLASGLCIVVAVTLGLSSSAPAHATLLNGGVEVVDTVSAPVDTTFGGAPVSNNAPNSITTGGAAPAQPMQAVPQVRAPQLQAGQPQLAYGRGPNVAQLTPPPNSFPANYSGRWQCVTRVVDSAVDTVSIGTELKSEVAFVDIPDGRVVARWVQPGWTETQASAMSWSSREAQTDRTSYYFGEGMNGAWASRSRDHFMQVATDRLECKSYVDQYLDGKYIGRYRTISVLTRLGTVNTIAQGAKSDK